MFVLPAKHLPSLGTMSYFSFYPQCLAQYLLPKKFLNKVLLSKRVKERLPMSEN